MMGAPGMRSAMLPSISRLDASRVRFLVRLWVHGQNRAEGLFNGHGGELRSSKLNQVIASLPKKRGRPSALSAYVEKQNDLFPAEYLYYHSSLSGIRRGLSG